MEKNNNNNNNNINNNNNNNNNNHHHNRERGLFNGDNNLVRTITHPPETRSTTNTTLVGTTSSDFVLKWGSSKRLRCMKVQGKDREGSSSGSRRAVRSDLNGSKEKESGNASNGFVNLRNSPAHRVTRNSEGTIAGMKGGHSNGASDKKAHNNNNNHNSNNNNNNHHNNNNINNGGVGSGSGSDTVHDSKKGGGTSSGSDAMPAVWPPKFVIALTNKEKEEDFYAFKGSKLPQRPKKRAKFVQRTLNLVSPGAWLCDLTLERYEVREKKISKKRPRGLKAMGNMESDSE